MRRRLIGLVDVRRAELRRLVPLTLAYGLVMASSYVLKPVRNALFLNRLGIEQLPYVLILVALIGGVTATFYSRFTRSIRIDRLVFGTFLVLISNLLIFRLVFPYARGWVFYIFYVWVNLSGPMSGSLLLLLANAAFDPREARRLFGIIVTGGNTGAILGGIFTGWSAKALGTENLLFVCMGLMGICLALVRMVRPVDAAVEKDSGSTEGALASVGRFDLLRSLAIMAGLAWVVAAVADVQFQQIASDAFPSEDAKTAFFGEFFACLNGFIFLIQLLLTPRILRSFGVGAALLFLPLSLAAGSLGVLLIPGLIGGIAVKVGDLGFRHSIHKSATEILFLPVPADIKKRTKVFLDTTVDNLATGLGAILVLLLTGIGVSYQHLGFLSLGLIAVWLGLLVRVRRAYVDAFRHALERREIDPGEFRMNISEAATIHALKAALNAPNERQVVYALDMLASVQGGNLAESVEPHLSHPSAEVRRKALLALQQGGGGIPLPRVEALLQDGDPEVRLEAIHFLFRHGGGDHLERMKAYLEDPDLRIQAAALGCIAEYGSPAEKGLVDESVIRAVLSHKGEEGVFSRVQAAKAMGGLEDPALRRFLRAFMEDPSPSVVRQTLRSLGRIGDPAYVSWMLDRLADRRFRVDARDSLSAMGPSVLGALTDRLDSEEGDPRVRRNIPRVLSEIQTRESVDILLDRLERAPPSLRYLLIKASSKLRTKAPGLEFDPDRVNAELIREAGSYYEMLRIRHLFRGVRESPAIRLLKRALVEKQGRNLECVFRLLGLCYPPRDIYHAYLGFVSGSRTLRASAIEFLDNVMDRDQKAYLLPFLDPASLEEAIEKGQALFGGRLETREEALVHLIQQRDPWLRVCAINSVGGATTGELARLVAACRDDPDALVSETAGMVVDKRGLRVEG